VVAGGAAAARGGVAAYGGARWRFTAAAAVWRSRLLNSSKTFPRCPLEPSSEFKA